MTLPSSGALNMNEVNVELGNSGTTQLDMNNSNMRSLYGIPTGAIRLAADGYGKSAVSPGSNTFSSPGTYYFTVPAYNTLTITVDGSGGGGGGGTSRNSGNGGIGGDGSDTSFNGTVVAHGGKGGTGGTAESYYPGDKNGGGAYDIPGSNGSAGADGAASGGTTNTTGGAATRGASGAAAATPDGGQPSGSGGLGGNGGLASQTYTPGMLIIRSLITIVIGTGGGGGAAGIDSSGSPGGAGDSGEVIISWS